MLTVAILDNGL